MKRKTENVKRYRIRLKIKFIAYKGGKCEKCGYDKPIPSAYDFHHRDPKMKDFQIGGSTLGFERIKAEVDKCDLVCKNCHAEIHDADWIAGRTSILSRARVPKVAKACEQCPVVFMPKRKEQRFCSRECQHKSMLRGKIAQHSNLGAKWSG